MLRNILSLTAFAFATVIVANTGVSAATYEYQVLSFPGGTGAYATGIANDMSIVGIGVDGSYLRTPEDVYVPIAYPGRINTGALGISNTGVIIGDVWNPSTLTYIGFIRAPDGDFSNFNFPDAASPNGGMQANDISDLGVVVGGGASASQAGGFVRFPDGTFEVFQYMGSVQTIAYGVNNLGQVSGQSQSGSFLRSPDGIFVPIQYAGAQTTQAFGVNNAGQVVGSWYHPDLGTHGFIRNVDGSYDQLDYPGARSTIAWSLNDYGDVVGFFDNSDGSRFAFLATPVPEPSTLLLLFAGTSMIGFVARSRARRGYSWEPRRPTVR